MRRVSKNALHCFIACTVDLAVDALLTEAIWQDGGEYYINDEGQMDCKLSKL